MKCPIFSDVFLSSDGTLILGQQLRNFVDCSPQFLFSVWPVLTGVWLKAKEMVDQHQVGEVRFYGLGRIFTSAKEVMFLPVFVCLSVCVLAR